MDLIFKKSMKGLELMLKMKPKSVFHFSLLSLCGTLLFSGSVTGNPIVKKTPPVTSSQEAQCPTGFNVSAGDKIIYCLKSNLNLPKGDVHPLCTDLAQGQIGFTWVSSEKTKGYACPLGSKQIKKDQNMTCLFTDLEMLKTAKNLKPYCHYLNKGYFGFSYTP